jgi:predicted acylesterase/phospholipase RssA
MLRDIDFGKEPGVRALSLPGCACRGAFQFAVMARLAAAGERFDVVAGVSSGSVCAAVTVAGLAEDGPSMWRAFASRPIVSARYLGTERSVFGMNAILRDALCRFLPEERLRDTEAELLVATTRARRFALFAKDALAVHSNRTRNDLHNVIVASCYIPVIYAGVPWLDGEVHVDGGAVDNTLIDTLVARGATELTVVTPYLNGAVSRTMFSPELPPSVPPHVRLRLIYPERPLQQRRFDFAPGPLEEALTMPHCERIVEAARPRQA